MRHEHRYLPSLPTAGVYQTWLSRLAQDGGAVLRRLVCKAPTAHIPRGDAMTTNKEPDAYIAQKACGCLTMAVVDIPEHKRDTAKEIAKAIRLGEVVTRVPTAQVRTMPWECAEHAKETP